MTTTTPKTCAHDACTETVADHELACRHHWYELPTRLRNRIWRNYQHDPGGTAHLDAIREAMAIWNPPPVQLRCHNCRRHTDFTDEETGQPICLTCATAGMNKTSGPGTCTKCGQDADILVSIDTHRPPHICIDCTIADLQYAEAYA